MEALIKTVAKKSTKWSNWAGNVNCYAEGVFYPRTEQEVQEIIAKAKTEQKTIRVVGSGHSFSQLIATNDFIVSLTYLSGIINIDKEKQQATIWAGTSIKEANEKLFEAGLAIINLGDIDVQSVGGATATGTHGTGTTFGNVSTEIVNFTILTADGQILDCSPTQNQALFEAGRVSLGALGIITKITLQLATAYKLEYTCQAGSFEETLDKLEDYNKENRNFEYYYFPYSETLQLKLSNESDRPVKHNKALAYFNDVIMENTVLSIACKIGLTFPSIHKKLSRAMSKSFPKGTKVNYSHQIYATVRNVKFKEMEYNIPIEHFKEVMLKMKALIEKNNYWVFFPAECRFVKGDDIWLSPAYGRDSAYIAVHVFKDQPHDPYFSDLEELFTQYGGRPHWGKMHTRKADYFADNYEKWNDFEALRQQMDPDGIFLNEHLKDIFGVA